MNANESKNRYLINNTIIFAIGNFATKIITFLLVPLYTNMLSTEQFGIVDLLYTICSFLIPLFSFNISEAILRFSLDKEKNDNKIISIGIVSMIFMIISSLAVIPILNVFKDFSQFRYIFYIYMITFGISQVLLINLKGQEKLKLYSLGNFIYALSVSLLNIIFLVVLKMDINGYFLAYILSNIIIIIYGLVFGNIFKGIKEFDFDKILFKEMIKYSVVLIPTSFMWWIMNFLDRVMVTKYISLSANGIYAVSYKIPTILSVVSSIFTQAWLFSAIKEKDSSDKEEFTNKIFKLLSFGTIFIGCFLLIILKLLFKFYVAADFYIAWKYVPFLMIGYVFLNLSTFISTSYNVNKDSKGHLFSALVGAIINCLLNFILIPTIGVYGAAIATLISYISVFLYRLFDTKKYLIIRIDNVFVTSILIMCLISGLMFFDKVYAYIIQIILIMVIVLSNKKIWNPIFIFILNKLKKTSND